MKKLVILSDLHCGHRTGITPPGYQWPLEGEGPRGHFARLQRDFWQKYLRLARDYSAPDVMVVNGDCIEGQCPKNSGVELISSDRNLQVEMAVKALKVWRAKRIVMVYGTAFHVGESEDFERPIADALGADIKAMQFVDICGTVFQFRHKIPGSSIPYGSFTPISKERIWNLLHEEHEEQPRADVIVRSHIHQFNFCGTDDYFALTTPGLQGLGSKFGSRQVSRTIDWGITWFNVTGRREYDWGRDIMRFANQKAKVIRI